MPPAITIVIPHKRTPLNDQAMELNIKLLMENTVNNFELILDTEVPACPYRLWNDAAKRAKGKILVFSNSDVLMAKGWDKPFIDNIQDNAILTGYLVEAGNIGVASVNIPKDFGKTPSTFDRQAFEAYAAREAVGKAPLEYRAWYMPCAFYRDWFIWTGGFDTSTKWFPEPLDIEFWERCISKLGTKLIRVPSFAYHFQNLSAR